MGRFIIELPSVAGAFQPQQRQNVVAGATPTDVVRGLQAATLAYNLLPDASTVSDFADGVNRVSDTVGSWMNPQQQAQPPVAAPQLPQNTPLPSVGSPVSVDDADAFQQAQLQHRQAVAAKQSDLALKQPLLAANMNPMLDGPDMLAAAMARVNAAQTPEELAAASVEFQKQYDLARGDIDARTMRPAAPMQPAGRMGPVTELPAAPAQQSAPQPPAGTFPPPAQPVAPGILEQPQPVQQQAVQPRTSTEALLVAKAAAEAGDMDAFRAALMSARTVDVSDMSASRAGELFSDRGKRERLVKAMLGLRARVDRTDPFAERRLTLQEQESRRKARQGDRNAGTAERRAATGEERERRQQRRQDRMLGLEAEYLAGKIDLNNFIAAEKQRLLGAGMPEKQVKRVMAQTKSALQAAKTSAQREKVLRQQERRIKQHVDNEWGDPAKKKVSTFHFGDARSKAAAGAAGRKQVADLAKLAQLRAERSRLMSATRGGSPTEDDERLVGLRSAERKQAYRTIKLKWKNDRDALDGVNKHIEKIKQAITAAGGTIPPDDAED